MPFNAALATVVTPSEIPGEAMIESDNDGVASVSYTHLHVYQFQSQNTIYMFLIVGIVFAITSDVVYIGKLKRFRFCYTPVSYTHLDVYKRQSWYCSPVRSGNIFPHPDRKKHAESNGYSSA